LPPGVTRLPITEAGCAGGVLALARAADFLHAHASAKRVLVVASELCSLAFHASAEAGNLISALIFGDGAAAAVLEKDPDATGLQIIDSASLLLPNSTEALGFDLTDEGFYPRLSRELPDILASPTADAAAKLAAKHGFGLSDVEFWLLHPGGPRVLEAVGSKLCLTERQAPWSWDSLRECGNMSSAAILDVIRRYLGDAAAPRGLGMIVAFGPGASIELLLVRRC
jgi:alkylresorcinol/alkylpyrone synthase